MGVMLSLDRPRPPRGRRHGQHARGNAGQPVTGALAALLRPGRTGARRVAAPRPGPRGGGARPPA
ncbi:MAG: hypothetical protein ACLQDY_00315, partial [Streptosporangiaceae bacterium]